MRRHYNYTRLVKSRDERGDHLDIIETLCQGATINETSRNTALYHEWRRYLERVSESPMDGRFMDAATRAERLSP